MISSSTRFAIQFPVVCILTIAASQSRVSADDLPDGVANSQNPADVSLTPQQSLERITVPEGFNVTLFAGEPDIRRPIAFDFDDRGRLWVVENYSHPKWKDDNATDRVVILEDEDNDGEFDKRTVFWDEGRYLTAIAWGHGGVWVGNTPELCFIPDRNGDDVPDGPPVVKLDGFQISTNNVINNFHWGPDGWLYGAIGLSSKSLVGIPGASDAERVQITRGIWRYHPYSERFEKIAEGMVNPWGADFNEYGDLITANTVLAHIWHIVPGMYSERRANERDNPFAYSRIQTIANHLHWGGGQWQTSRNPSSRREKKGQPVSHTDDHDEAYHQHSVAGGGHAHCGGMIYLGTNWPKEYRGTFFTNNLHGNRVNNDRLVPSRSTYVAEHADDFLFGNDPWFRGMQIKYGPDGGVYISDWHDYGECHDSDGSHRTSGRIYKVTYGAAKKPELQLAKKSSLELAKLQTHSNEWLVRHARRLLQERGVVGEDLSAARTLLLDLFASPQNGLYQLRAVWALHALNQRLPLNATGNNHVDRWLLRLYSDQFRFDAGTTGNGELTWMPESDIPKVLKLSLFPGSAKVRLEAASVLQRMSLSDRHRLAELLAQVTEDARDPFIPLMIWYGFAPAVEHNVEQALSVAEASQIPLVREYIARRLTEADLGNLNALVALVREDLTESRRLSLLTGIAAGLTNEGNATPPEGWTELFAQLQNSRNSELKGVAIQLAVMFGDRVVIQSMRERVVSVEQSIEVRRSALQSLAAIDNGLTTKFLHTVVAAHPQLCSNALTILLTQHDESTADFLIQQFSSLTNEQKGAAVSVLATRRTFAQALLNAIVQGTVARDDVSAYALQQLRSFRDEDLRSTIATIWKNDDVRLEKADEITRLTALMTPDYLSSGDILHGRHLFNRTCAKCHRLFGEGGTIAPDLTGSGRKKADYIIRNLVDPSAEIDAAYRLTTVVTTDGRLFTGFIVKQDDSNIEVRTQDTTVRMKMNDVDELSTSNLSMMPEGMLKTLPDDDFRDLLVYLASEEQVAPSN